MLKLNLTLPVKAEDELVVAQLVSVGVDKQTSEHRIEACKTSSGEEASLARASTIGELLESNSEHFPCTEMCSTRKSLSFTFFWLAQQLELPLHPHTRRLSAGH